MSRCQFVFKAYERSCGHPPTEGIWHELPTGDFMEVLFCEAHGMAYRAIMAADRQRHVIPDPPGTDPET